MKFSIFCSIAVSLSLTKHCSAVDLDEPDQPGLLRRHANWRCERWLRSCRQWLQAFEDHARNHQEWKDPSTSKFGWEGVQVCWCPKNNRLRSDSVSRIGARGSPCSRWAGNWARNAFGLGHLGYTRLVVLAFESIVRVCAIDLCILHDTLRNSVTLNNWMMQNKPNKNSELNIGRFVDLSPFTCLRTNLSKACFNGM